MILKMLKYLRPVEWLYVAICVALLFLQVFLDLRSPAYMSEMTTMLTTEGTTVADIWSVGIWMLLCALGAFGTNIVVIYFAIKIASGVSFTVRHLQFAAVESYSMTEIHKFSIPSLITRSTNDVTQVQMVLAMGLIIIVRAPIMVVMAITQIANKDWHWTTVTILAVVIMLAIMITLVLIVLPKFRKVQWLTDNLNRITEENLTGIRVIRAYNAEKYQTEKFEKANNDLTKTMLFTTRMMALLNPVIMLIMYGLTLAVYWVGAYVIDAAGMEDKLPLFSDMVVFTSYAMMIVMAFLMLVIILVMLPRAQVAAKRIHEVIDTKSSINDGPMDNPQTSEKGLVEFKNVSFKFENGGANILTDINFTARKGETVAVIGSTGSGKSALIKLIPRFYEASEGEVLVDGVNVREYTGKALRKKIGYVSQKAVMFRGSVRSNIDFGDNFDVSATDEEIEKAVRISQSEEFVNNMDGGFDAEIAQGGQNISGGQKQRLSIARAVARNAEIYIFDDSFSALDYKTDKVLRSALRKEMKDATIIIVAQRIGTIKNADKILVLDEGRIVGMGRHEDLLESCKVYQEIAYSQLSKEELA